MTEQQTVMKKIRKRLDKSDDLLDEEMACTQTVMPRMRLYLLCVEARLRDISAFWNDRKCGIFAQLM